MSGQSLSQSLNDCRSKARRERLREGFFFVFPFTFCEYIYMYVFLSYTNDSASGIQRISCLLFVYVDCTEDETRGKRYFCLCQERIFFARRSHNAQYQEQKQCKMIYACFIGLELKRKNVMLFLW